MLDYLFAAYRLDAELDHALFMEDVAQEWGRSFLYAPDAKRINATVAAEAA